MIDSTGIHTTITIDCNHCQVQFPLPIYTPQFGHCGEAVDAGSYFESLNYDAYSDLVQVFEAGRLFTLIRHSDPDEVEVYYMYPSSDSYSYDGASMPQFGLQEGEVIWVCKRCVRSLQWRKHPWAQVLHDWEEKNHREAAPCLTSIRTRWM